MQCLQLNDDTIWIPYRSTSAVNFFYLASRRERFLLNLWWRKCVHVTRARAHSVNINICILSQSEFAHMHTPTEYIRTANPNNIIVRVYDCVCVYVCANEGIVICICGREGKKGSRSETIIVNNPSTQSHRSFSVSNLKFIIVCLNYVHSVRYTLYPSLVATSEFSSSSSFVYVAALHIGRTRNRVAKQWEHINCF